MVGVPEAKYRLPGATLMTKIDSGSMIVSL